MIPFETEEVEGTIGERFRRVASHAPQSIALRTDAAAVTYAELDAASDAVAGAVIARRGTAAEPVAVLLEEGAESLSALLGIIKAGKSAIILAPEFSPERLSAIWEDALRPLVLVNRSTRSLAGFIPSPDLLLDLDQPQPHAADLSAVHPGPDTLAVITYTSGSTGEPKGVMWPHRFVLHTARYNLERYQLSEQDRCVFVAAYGFSAALIQHFVAVLNGAAIYLFPNQTRELKLLEEWLRRERITLLHLTSFGLLRQWGEAAKTRVDLPSLRCVLLSGEELYRQDLERFRAFFPPSVDYSYRLAGSEALMISELRILPETALEGEKVPAGYAVPDKELLLLDSAGRPVPAGEMGQIAVRSRFLADGYWHKPELTRAVFLPDPEGGERRIFVSSDLGRFQPDGQLLFLGRKDNIVRVRGFIIQLEAVDSALQRLPGIREAAAAARDLPDGNKRLVGYLVPEPGRKPFIADLRRELMSLLPAYMIPTRYVFLETLPRTAMERIDRQALPPPGSDRPNLDTPFVEPRTEIETRLCALWSGLIGLERVGVEDDFFLLGGDSLLTMNMVLQVEETFGRQIPLGFFREPTISHLVRLWESDRPAPEQAGPRELEISTPLSASPRPMTKKRAAAAGKLPQRKQFRSRLLAVRSYTPPPLRTSLPRVAAEQMTLLLDYPSGCRWLSWWCRQPFVVKNFYPAEEKLFHRWLERLGIQSSAPAEALNINLMTNIIWSWRFKKRIPLLQGESFLEELRHSSSRFLRDAAQIIESAPPERLDRFFPVEGLEHVHQALRQGRGVILLTYHGTTNRFTTAALPRRLNGKLIPTLSLTEAIRLNRKESRGSKLKLHEAALLANIALEGHRMLEGGGIVQVIPDIGYNAADGLPLVIGGFQFLIKPGFAELAILTNAVVIPLLTTRRMDGQIYTKLFPPFTHLSGDQDRRSRVYHLLDQYAAFVGQAWKMAPESLKWQAIDTHLNRPAEKA